MHLRREVVVRLDEEAAGATRGVEHGLAELRIGDIDHELHDRTRGVELAGIARRVAHLAEHVFVKAAKSVHLFAGGEVDAADFVDDVAQEVAGLHAVGDPLEHVGDDILPRLTGLGLESAQVGEQTRALACRRAAWFRPG